MKHRFSGRSKPPSHVRVRPRRIEEGLAALSLGDTNLDLHGLAERKGLSDGARRATRAALGRLRRLRAEPLAPEPVLSCAALRLRTEAADVAADALEAAGMIGTAAEPDLRLRRSAP